MLLFATTFVYSQVGIGTTTPSDAAMLEISGQTPSGVYKGFMPPRVPTVVAQNSIAPGPAEAGLMVYNEETDCLNLWNGIAWENVYCLGANNAVWINEFHYADAATPTDEFIEIAGIAGTDLTGYYIARYNGANNRTYGALVYFTGTIDDEGSGYGAITVSVQTLQEGFDGLALLDPNGNVLQFISYEGGGGTFAAAAGPARGFTSVSVGVEENNTTASTQSIHLTGTGTTYNDFTWSVSTTATPGDLNIGQTF